MSTLRFIVLCATTVIAPACSDSTNPAPAPPATQLAFTGQPASDTVDAALAPVKVTARDAAGAVATEFTGTITVAMGLNPGNASLSGTLAVPAVAGVATFSDLSLSAAEDGYTLTATSGTLVGAMSAAFAVSEVVATLSMRYEADALDLESGTVRDCAPGSCFFQPAEDLNIAYNALATPPGVVFQNQANNTEIAHLARAFSGVHLADTTGAGFSTQLESDPFDDAHTVLIRTAAGNVFKLGNAVHLSSTNTVRFQFARLN